MAKHLTKRQFLQISRDVKACVKAGVYNAQKLGDFYGVHPETIRRIKKAKTWNGFLALKAARQTSPKTSKVEKQVQENAVTSEETLERVTAEKLHTERELATALNALNERPTRAELDEERKAIHGRQDVLLTRTRSAERAINRQGVALNVLIFVVVVTLVIAIVK